MSQSRLDAEKITRPIQLVAAWFVTLVLLVGAFLTAATMNSPPNWLPVLFGIAAIVFVPVFAAFVYRLQTKYRPELQEDKYYSKYRDDESKLKGFQPENLAEVNETPEPAEVSNPSLIAYREEILNEKRSVFVVHTWRPSTAAGQVADISIRLKERRKGEDLLSNSKIESVEYYLGRLFFNGRTVVKTNAEEDFRLDVAAYGSPLCVARVHFRDPSSPDITLYRFCDIAETRAS